MMKARDARGIFRVHLVMKARDARGIFRVHLMMKARDSAGYLIQQERCAGNFS